MISIQKKVFSVDNEACRIINEYILNTVSEADKYYIDELLLNKLVAKGFSPRRYVPSDCSEHLNTVWLEITSACNLRCVHCYEGELHNRLADSLSELEWLSLIEELSELKVDNVIVIGGEPVISPYVRRILEKLYLYKINTTLFTNATLISDTLIDIIRSTRAVVKTSVYGHNSQVHESVTSIPGSFDKMLTNVKKMIDCGITVIAAIIIMKENISYLNDILKFAKGIGMKVGRYDVIRNVFGGCQSEHIPELSDEVHNYIYKTKPLFYANRKYFDKAVKFNTCWFGKLSVLENGDVIPCEFEREIKYGNVRKNKIVDIIKLSETQKYWRYDFSKIEKCRVCEYRFACKDCRPLGISIKGSISDKNPRCLYNPYTGKWG